MLLTSFLIHFYITRENGTQIHLVHIWDAEEITLPRAILDEKTKYLLTVTTYNHFGTSQSDPFILCVKDIGKLLLLSYLNRSICFIRVHLANVILLSD